jgi:hypothetical protein
MQFSISVFDFMDKNQITDVLARKNKDDTDALKAFFAAIQNNHGGSYVIPPYIFYVTPLDPQNTPEDPVNDPREALFNLTKINGVIIHGDGATIKDTRQTYASGKGSILLRCTECSNMTLTGFTIESERYQSFIAKTGLEAIDFRGFNEYLTLDLAFKGGLYGVSFAAPRGQPEFGARKIIARIVAENTYYPFLCEASGYNVKVEIYANQCGRNAFIWGVHNQKLTIFSKAQYGATEIASYSGRGCSDIDLTYHEPDCSTTDERRNCIILLQWTDSMPATHKNIKIHLNIRNVSKNRFGPRSILFSRLFPGQDDVLDGFDVSGVDESVSGTFGGNWGTGGEQRNIRIHDLHSLGEIQTSSLDLGALTDTAELTNVTIRGRFRIHTPQGGTIALDDAHHVSMRFGGAIMAVERGTAKVWLHYDGRSSEVKAALNVAKVDRLGKGNYQVYFVTPFLSACYAVVVSTTAALVEVLRNTSSSVGIGNFSAPGVNTDSEVFLVAYGD